MQIKLMELLMLLVLSFVAGVLGTTGTLMGSEEEQLAQRTMQRFSDICTEKQGRFLPGVERDWSVISFECVIPGKEYEAVEVAAVEEKKK